MGCHFLLQGIFPTQGSNLDVPRCRQTLYRLSDQGSQGLYKRLFMEKEIVNELICFLIIGLHVGWMIYLGKSIISLPISMKFTFSSLIPFSLFSLLNISKASSSISFTLTEKEHAESRMFAHEDPGKFLNAEQKFESPTQIELHSYKWSPKQFPFPMTQMSAVYLKNESSSNSGTRPCPLPTESTAGRQRFPGAPCFGGSIHHSMALTCSFTKSVTLNLFWTK